MLDLIEKLDLTGIERVYQHRDARGEKGHHPAMMTALLLYGYAIGVASSRRLERTAGARPRRLTADAGYWSEANAGTCDDRHIDAYIATGRSAHGHASAPLRGRPPKHLDAKGRMSRKVRTKKGRAAYARRKAVVEPCFGQIKGRGFRQLLLRGLDKVRGEWALMATTHNLLKYYRCAWRPA